MDYDFICTKCGYEFDYAYADRTYVEDYDYETKSVIQDKRLCCPECGSIETEDLEDS